MDTKNQSKQAETLRGKIHDRTVRLQSHVEKCSCDALEKVLYERMDTYFAQEGRLDELEKLLVMLVIEIQEAKELLRLKQIAERLVFLENHFEEIDSVMFDRPMRPRRERFNFFRFFRQGFSELSRDPGSEIRNKSEAFGELDLPVDSDFKQVKTAFRKLVKEHHPDQNNGDRKVEPKLRRLVAAYDFIKKRC